MEYNTHQVISSIDDDSQTKIVRANKYFKDEVPAHEAIIELPNAQAALDFQKSMINEGLGQYDTIDNSCLSHVVDVLNNGGLDISKSKREYFKLLKSNGFGRLI